jgi:signal peptide peptidase SppA
MSERPAPHVWAYAVATSWAILPERLPAIFEIAARENLDLEAVAAKLGRPLDNARAATVRDGIAVIPVEGTIFPRASLFAQISGGVAADEIARDLRAALDDPGVAGIVLNVDSPGGDVNGVAEVAAMIHAARDRKPIVAYVRDLGASAAYWLACAASEVVVASTALVGSIGIVGTVADPTKQTTRSIEFVSSQSPLKRADPTTQAGAGRIQARVDELAALFIADVAAYRGVTPERVAADFGQGDVLVGQKAVDAGLADRVGSFEGVIAELQAKAREPRRMMGGGRMAAQGGHMTQDQGRFQRFMAWLGGEGDDSAFAAANIAAAGPPTPPEAPVAVTMGSEPAHTVATVAFTDAHDPEIERLRAQVARLEAAAAQDAAVAWAGGEVAASRAVPAEFDALVESYATASADDAAHPRAEGQPSRVAQLAARQAARPRHSLTQELVPVRVTPEGGATVLDPQATTEAEGAPRPMAVVGYRDYLAATGTGRRILSEHGIPATGDLTAAQHETLAGQMRQKGLAVAR